MLDEQGWLDDVPTVPWEDGGAILTPRFTIYELDIIHHLYAVHPSLQFISHIPHSITGEQLVNQFLRCIPDKTWLFRYGRVPLNLIMGEWVWQVSSGISSYIHPSLRVLLFYWFTCLEFLFVCFFVRLFVSPSRHRGGRCGFLLPGSRFCPARSVQFGWGVVHKHPFPHRPYVPRRSYQLGNVLDPWYPGQGRPY